MPDAALADAVHVSTLAGGRAGGRDGHPQMAGFCFPGALAADGQDVWVAEAGRACLRLLREGQVATVAGGRGKDWPWAQGMAWPGVAMDEGGQVWVAGWTPRGVVHIDGVSPPAWADEEVSDYTVVDLDGQAMVRSERHAWCSPLAPAEVAAWSGEPLVCLAVAPDGTAWFAAPGDARALAIQRPELAGPAGVYLPLSRVAPSQVGLYIARPEEGCVLRLDADGTLTPCATGLAHPVAIAADAQGHCVIAERDAHRLWIITPEGQVQWLAGGGSPGFVDGAGPAARFDHPSGVALTPGGDILVADAYNHAIRRLQLFTQEPAPVSPHEPPSLLSAPGEIVGRRLQAWRWDPGGVVLELGYARAVIAAAAARFDGAADLATALDQVEAGGQRIARLEVRQTTRDGPPWVRSLAFENGLVVVLEAPMQGAPEAAVDPWNAWIGRRLERLDQLGIETADAVWEPSVAPLPAEVMAVEATFTLEGGCYPVALAYTLSTGQLAVSAPEGLMFAAEA